MQPVPHSVTARLEHSCLKALLRRQPLSKVWSDCCCMRLSSTLWSAATRTSWWS